MDDDAARASGEALATRYAAIHAGPMRDMPVCNAALRIAAIGFRPLGDNAAGIIITPWFMNIVISGPLAHDAAPGARMGVALPAGDIDCVAGVLEGFGPILSCSLFSPMFEFIDMAGAEAAAEEAMRALFDAALLSKPCAPARDGMDRRALLFGQSEARA